MARNLPESLTLIAARLTRYVQQDAPRIIGKMHRDHIAEAFTKEGYTDATFEKWPEVKRRQEGGKKKGGKQGRKILDQTGNLKRGFGYEINDGSVEVGTDVTYAEPHNEGTDNAGRNRNTKIPKRQFLGKSETLEGKIKDKFSSDITNILK